jgi:hypothetical protein
MDAVESKKTESKKYESLILDLASAACLASLVAQVETEIGSLINVSQKVVANFIIKNRSHPLTSEELEQLKQENFDLVRALRKATEQVLKAKRDGNEIDLDRLVKVIQTPSVSKNSDSLKAPQKRKRKKTVPVSSDPDTLTVGRFRESGDVNSDNISGV